MQVHINAPAHCWSSRAEKPNKRGEDRNTGYTTRSQNTRNPERISHGKVARNRYKSMDDSGHFQLCCSGRMTGDQNRRPVARKDACSTPCHVCDRKPSINTEGICHRTNVPAAANQQTTGCVSTLVSCCIVPDFSGRLIACTNRCSKPCARGFRGMPSKINGGA